MDSYFPDRMIGQVEHKHTLDMPTFLDHGLEVAPRVSGNLNLWSFHLECPSHFHPTLDHPGRLNPFWIRGNGVGPTHLFVLDIENQYQVSDEGGTRIFYSSDWKQ